MGLMQLLIADAQMQDALQVVNVVALKGKMEAIIRLGKTLARIPSIPLREFVTVVQANVKASWDFVRLEIGTFASNVV